MSIREQYRLAYSLLRDPDYGSWDYPTFKIVAMGLGIDQPARIAALRSYNQSRQIDEIGKSYRNLVRNYQQIHLATKLGYIPYL